jgi:tight adherence protein B
MRRAAGVVVRILAAAALAVGVVLPAAAQETEPELTIDRVDASNFPVVEVVVTPPESLRDADITPDDVTLTEDGEVRGVEVSRLIDEPLEVVLAIDTSGSMSGEALEGARSAAATFVASMPESTQIAVMSFASEPRLVSEFTDDESATLSAIASISASGDTALYDAAVAAVQAFDPGAQAPRFVVILSDGGDTVSNTSLVQTTELLTASSVVLYAVELQTEESDPVVLEELAAAGSGRLVSAENTAALTDAYGEIASELVSQVVLTYTSASGGVVDLGVTIDVGGTVASTTARLALPSRTGTTTTAPATTQPAPASTAAPEPATPTSLVVSPPTPFVNTGGGFFSEDGALVVGIAAVFVAALIVFGLAVSNDGRALDVLQRTGRASTRAATTSGQRKIRGGGALSRLAESSQELADRLLRRGTGRSRINELLEAAGSELAPGEFLVITISGVLAGAIIGFPLFGLAGGFLLSVLGLTVPWLVMVRQSDKRRDDFGDQLEGTLQLMAGSLRAGYGLMQAVNTVALEAPSPTSDEFNRIVVETRLGRDLVDSLHAMAGRVGSDDFRWVAQAIDIQRSVGGDLARTLDNVAETIRDRNQIRRQIRALSAEGRISAYVLISLPIIITGAILVLAPGFLDPLTGTTAGRVSLLVGGVLLVLGVLWIRRIIRLVF